MTNIRKFTDDEIRTINVGRKISCINSSGECYIVSVYFIYDNERHIEVTNKLDVNVFATATEACVPTKRAYVVRFHAMD